MSQDHRLQAQRFELKYLVPDHQTLAIRDFISCYLEQDDYSVGKPNFSYEIHSVYFDSIDLNTHHSTRNGDKNRFKLRLRYYDDKPGSPVFVEIKQREDNCILKQRCGVRPEVIPLIAAGHLPDADCLLSRNPRQYASLQKFNDLQLRLNASPRLHNRYQREAWVSTHDNSVRVTFDRHIYVEPYFGDRAVVAMTQPRRIYAEFVVLELKFTGRFPNWFNELVEQFHLMRSTAQKYSGGVEQIGEGFFSRPAPKLIPHPVNPRLVTPGLVPTIS